LGQKAHPYGLRVGYIKTWRSRWFMPKNQAAAILQQDLKIRDYIKNTLGYAGIADIEIERSSTRVRVRIHTARPGVIIGRRGQEIDKVKEQLSKIAGGELFLDIKEVKIPQISAQLVAENIALQLQKRVAFRRTMKRAVQLAMGKGALGIKVICKGRLGGSEIARQEVYHEGKVPLSTFRADVDYGFTEARTTYGAIGCKVWIYKGEIFLKKEQAAERRARQQRIDENIEQNAQKEEAEAKKTRKTKKAEAVSVSTDAEKTIETNVPEGEEK